MKGSIYTTNGKRKEGKQIENFLGYLSPYQILVLGFAALILTGALLLTLPAAARSGQTTSFLTALFTATSAVCVTGLVLVDTGTHYSLFGQLVIIGLIQVGGLGIMTMTTLFALLLGKKINLRERLLIREGLNVLNLEGVVSLVKSVIGVTALIESIGALILAFRFVPDLGWIRGIYFSFWHSISSFCNAGFDLFGTVYGPFSSLTPYRDDLIVSLTIPSLIILGGLGFVVIKDLAHHRKFSRLSLHSKIVLTISGILIVGGTFFIWLLERQHSLQGLSPLGMFLASFFQAVTPRTAGYNTLNIGTLRGVTQFLMIILMFIGASPSGTGGGIKTTTFGALVLTAWSVIVGKNDTEVFRRNISREIILKSLTIFLLSAALVVIITMILISTENAGFLAVLFETVSAFGTVGLTIGITPHLTVIGQVLIIITMYAGRVGPLTVALAIWQHRKVPRFSYPQEKIIVG